MCQQIGVKKLVPFTANNLTNLCIVTKTSYTHNVVVSKSYHRLRILVWHGEVSIV